MTNFKTAVDASADALDSEGSAIEENNKRMDSLQGKLTKLDSAWQQFSKNTINSTVIKSLLDLSVNLLKLADTDTARALTSFVAITASLNLLSKGMTALKTIILSNGKALYSYSLILQGVPAATAATSASMLTLTNSVKLLTTALLSNPLFWGGVAVTAIFAVKDAIEKQNEAQREAQAEISETNKKEAEELETSKKVYENLIDKTNKTVKENEELQDSIDKLVNKYDIEKKQLEGNTEERQKAIDKINEEIKAKKQAAAYAQTGSVDFGEGEREALESGKGVSYDSTTETSWSDVWNRAKYLWAGGDLKDSYKAQGSTLAELSQQMEKYISIQSQKQNLDGKDKAQLEKVTSDYNKLTERISKYKEAYKLALDNLADGIPITEQQANALYSLGMITKDQFNTWASGGKVIVETTEKQQEQDEVINNLTNSTKNFESALSENISTLANYSNQMDMLTTAQKELDNSGNLTVDTFKNLQDNGLLQYLELVNGKLQINTKAFEDSADAAKQQAVANLQASAATQIQTIMVNDLNGKYADMDAEAIVAATSTANASNTAGKSAENYKNLADNINYGTESYKAFYKAQAGQDVKMPEYKEFTKQATEAINVVIANTKAAEKAIKGLSLGTTTKKKSRTSSTKSAQSEYKATIDTLYKYSNALDIAKNRVTDLNKELSNTDNLEDQEKITRRLIDAINNQIQKTNDLKDAQTRQMNDYINQLRQQGFSIDYNNQSNELYINNMEHLADFSGDTAKNLENLIKKIQSLNSENVSLDGSVKDLTSNTKKYYDQLAKYPEKKLKQFKDLLKDFQQSQLDQVQNQIDDIQHAMENDPQLKALKEQLEAMKSQTDEKDKQAELEEKMLAVEKAREALENAKKNRTLQVWTRDKGWTYVADPDTIKDAQDALKDTEKELSDYKDEQRQDELEKQIEDLEKSYQNQIDKLQDFLDEQNYQIDKANRSAIQSFEDLTNAMKKYGIDSADYLRQAKDWLDNYNKSLAEAKNNISVLAKSGNSVVYSSDIQGLYTQSMAGIEFSGVSLNNVSAVPIGNTNTSNIHIDKIELPSVTNADEFVEALKNLPNLAIANATKRK